MKPTDRVLVEMLVAAPIDTVRRALRDPQEIARWFGWECPSLAEEIDMIFSSMGESPEAAETEPASEWPNDHFAVEAFGPDHTIVRVIRSAKVTDKSWKGIYDDTVDGWLTFVEQLRFFLIRHHGADRRTLYLNGSAPTADVPPPAEALGLTRLAIVPIGQRYSVKTPMGDTLEGEVWFRAANLIGLTVDAYGDGLLVVATRPVTAKSPHGGGKVNITTYGLDDATRAGVQARWIAWWRSRYNVIDIQPAEG